MRKEAGKKLRETQKKFKEKGLAKNRMAFYESISGGKAVAPDKDINRENLKKGNTKYYNEAVHVAPKKAKHHKTVNHQTLAQKRQLEAKRKLRES